MFGAIMLSLRRCGTVLVLVLCALGACGKQQGRERHLPPYDLQRLLAERAGKDRSLALSPDSPIPDSLRHRFTGLAYYLPDTSLRFFVALEHLPTGPAVSIPASGGETRRMTRYGRLHFTSGATACTLTAYIAAEHPSQLFVPFIDGTSGTETYEAGRYIDLERTPDDHYLLDFNRAYNPYCAYNASYSCPRVPRENVLVVPIRAGERNGEFTH